MDKCQTPPYAIEPLMDWIDPTMVVWEPAAGEGIMARALIAKGFHVVCSDIEPQFSAQLPLDFLIEQMPYHYDCIVTNPPFSLKYEWIERCYDLGRPFALLLPLETLGSTKAQRLFQKNGICVLLMSPRVDFKMPDAGWLGGGAQFPTAWFLGGDNMMESDERNRFFIHRMNKTDKQVLHDLDEAGNL